MALINHLLQSYGYLAVFLFVALESVGIPLPADLATADASVAGNTRLTALTAKLADLAPSIAAIATVILASRSPAPTTRSAAWPGR